MYDDGYPSMDERAEPLDSNIERLTKEIVGHRIVRVEKNATISPRPYSYAQSGTVITLDNQKQVILADTNDCCAYTELEAFLLHPDKVDHIITGVRSDEGRTLWSIYADMGDVLELTVGWSEGNPFYYGYGFEISVSQ